MTALLARRSISRRVGMRMLQAVVVFGLGTLVFALSRNMALSLVALVVMGAADTVSVVIRHSLVQLRTPDAMRGRVGAVNFLFINASNQLGEFESGMTAALFGAVPAAVIGGLGTIGGGAAVDADVSGAAPGRAAGVSARVALPAQSAPVANLPRRDRARGAAEAEACSRGRRGRGHAEVDADFLNAATPAGPRAARGSTSPGRSGSSTAS